MCTIGQNWLPSPRYSGMHVIQFARTEQTEHHTGRVALAKASLDDSDSNENWILLMNDEGLKDYIKVGHFSNFSTASPSHSDLSLSQLDDL
jgi:hypothetical protein